MSNYIKEKNIFNIVNSIPISSWGVKTYIKRQTNFPPTNKISLQILLK